MRRAITGIDHVVIAVRDLDRAQETYARLGFTLTPRGFHTLGSANHCIMFGGDYVELLALPVQHPAMRYYADFLARGEGLAAVALASTDADAAYAELAADGIEADSPLDFSRPVELPNGERDAAFRIVQLAPAQTPGCRSFVCQHRTPDLVWRPGYQTHTVGATGLAALAVVANFAAGRGASARGGVRLLLRGAERSAESELGVRVRDVGHGGIRIGLHHQQMRDRALGHARAARELEQLLLGQPTDRSQQEGRL